MPNRPAQVHPSVHAVDGRLSRTFWIGPLIALVISLALVLLLNRFLPLLHGPVQWAAAAASCVLVTLMLLAAGVYRRLGYVVVGFVLLFGCLQRYIQSMGIREPNVLVTDLMETDLRELGGFIDATMILGFAAVALAALLIVRLQSAATPQAVRQFLAAHRRTGPVLAVTLVALAIGGMALPKPRMEEAEERVVQAAAWPLVPVAQTLRVFKGYWSGEKQFAHLIDTLPNAAAFPSTFSPSDQGLTVVFVFGESLRADHWGLNGYRRNTTPRLRTEPNLVNFPDTLSFGTYTQVSAIGMMTPASFAQPLPRAGSFVDLFAKHGFETGAFIASRPTSVQLRLISSIKQRERQRGPAKDLLPGLRAFLEHGDSARQFLFVYTEGNHFPYSRGYTPDFAQFKPDDHGRANLSGEVDKLTNAYDNAVLYTDSFLADIIDGLRNKRAVLVYAADHGDALGDDGNFIRGGTLQSPYLRQVPFFVWVSDTYQRTDPDKVRQLRANAGLKVAHEHLFSTVLSLAGIHTELADPLRDLTSEKAAPRSHEAADGAPVNSPFHIKR